MKKLNNIVSGPLVLSFLIISNALLFWMLSNSIAALSTFAGGMEILDLKPLGYNFDYVNTLLETLGSSGREYYLNVQLPIDFIYPFLFALAGVFFIQYLVQKNGKSNTKLNLLVLLPLLGGLSDYFENFSIIYMLTEFPDITDGMVLTSSFFSILKTIATTLYWCAALFLGVQLLLTRFKKH